MTFLSFLLPSGPLAVLHRVLDSNFKLCVFIVNELIKEEIEKPSGQYLNLICDESMTCRCLNLNPRYFGSFIFISVLFRESCLLVSWCAGGRCGMACINEDHDRSRRPGAEDRGWSHRSGTWWPDDREVGWCCVRSAQCTRRQGAQVS
jgi:hypothetical protein